jgi:hypothetical protein
VLKRLGFEADRSLSSSVEKKECAIVVVPLPTFMACTGTTFCLEGLGYCGFHSTNFASKLGNLNSSSPSLCNNIDNITTLDYVLP